jgi:2-haloalkanoic acid dehalogenase type II
VPNDNAPRLPSDTGRKEWRGLEPSVLVFDVNETLIDVESMNPLFVRLFDDKRVLREWFGHLVTYSMTVTLSGLYEPYFSLGRGLLKMVGDIHDVEVGEADLDELEAGMRGMPAHPDAEEGLTLLKDAGFRMVTLTNSPHVAGAPSPLARAGLDAYFATTWWRRTSGCRRPRASWSPPTCGTPWERRAPASPEASSPVPATPRCRCRGCRSRMSSQGICPAWRANSSVAGGPDPRRTATRRPGGRRGRSSRAACGGRSDHQPAGSPYGRVQTVTRRTTASVNAACVRPTSSADPPGPLSA